MKNTRTKYRVSVAMLVAILSMGVISCEKEHLNPIPKTAFSDKVVFDTPDRIALQVNNLYSQVKNGNFLGGRAQIYGDVRANDFINRTTNGVTAYLVWQQTINEASQNDVINMWTFAYQAINQINVFIEGMDANAEKFVAPVFPPTFAATAASYVAEAKFLRAVSYHTLLMFYARPWADGSGAKPGLPLRLKGEKDSNGNDLARSTVDQVYAQIIQDLNDAEAGLPANYGTDALLNTTRAHKNSAIAFKTRVYLTKGDYANVITEANKIVPAGAPFTATSGVPHALQANVNNVFTGAQQTTETILSMPFTAQNTPGGQNQLGFYYRASAGTNVGGGEFSLNSVTGIYADLVAWPAADARRTNFTYQQGTEYYLGKYPSGTPYLDRAPIMRWPEVLLNLSEAIARTSSLDTRAISLVNAVRTRSAGVPNAWVPVSNTELIDDIMTERRIEFLGEGLRNQDIMRLLQPFPGKGSVPAVPTTNAVWVWPIPLTERLANALIEPN